LIKAKSLPARKRERERRSSLSDEGLDVELILTTIKKTWTSLLLLFHWMNLFQAVKSKNVRDYVKWMMYWIVFALFSSLETLMDPFLLFW
jgi:hypothetical protein